MNYIAVIDYGLGNVRSIINALASIGHRAILTNDQEEIHKASGLILPGVGSFKNAMKLLHECELESTIKKYGRSGRPVLGICLGMQLLFESSEEFGFCKGLNLVDGEVVLLPLKDQKCQKLPHVSWNNLESRSKSWVGSILSGIEEASNVYFVHSYVCEPANDAHVLSVTNYSEHLFCSTLQAGNIYGTQYHPERSGKVGLSILRNFTRICEESKK